MYQDTAEIIDINVNGDFCPEKDTYEFGKYWRDSIAKSMWDSYRFEFN